MRYLALAAILLAALGAASAQDGLQPKFDIPPTIAKVPEQSDFFGNWLRGDGGYRIEIEADSKSPTGVTARYYNPDLIHVESATFDSEAKEPTLIIVLRDEGYPGSTYQIRFLSERRVLIGSYARPGSQPSEVYFVRKDEQ